MKKLFLFLALFCFTGNTFAQNEISFSKENKTLEVEINVPLTESKMMNKHILTYIKNVIVNLKKETNNFEKLSNDSKYAIYISATKNTVGDITTYELSNYNFTGGAHGNTITTTLNFQKDGSVINILNQKLLDKISAYSIKYFLEELKSGNISSDEEWIKEGLSPKQENFQNYIIKNNDKNNFIVEFIFDQYQIAPYVEGQKTIEINLNNL